MFMTKFLYRLTYSLAIIGIAVAFAVATPLVHSAAMPSMQHAMSGAEEHHEPHTNTPCLSLCTSAVVNQPVNSGIKYPRRLVKPISNQYYLAFTNFSHLENKHLRVVAIDVDHPPRVPPRILYGIFRA